MIASTPPCGRLRGSQGVFGWNQPVKGIEVLEEKAMLSEVSYSVVKEMLPLMCIHIREIEQWFYERMLVSDAGLPVQLAALKNKHRGRQLETLTRHSAPLPSFWWRARASPRWDEVFWLMADIVANDA